MRAMVFAAGRGSRLDPLTQELPKPAVPVAHRPLICQSLDRLALFGVSEVRVNVHHLGERMEPALKGHLPHEVPIHFVHEAPLLGTGGGLRNAFREALPTDATVIMNGDIEFAPDLARAVAAHQASDAIATMVLRAHPNPTALGAVEVDPDGRVRKLLGRPDARGPLEAFMFTGVHVLAPRAFRDLPAEGCIIRHAYRRWVDEGEVVMSVIDQGHFADLGTLRSYLEANLAFARGARPALGAPCDARAGRPLIPVHEDAAIAATAEVRESVVGAGAVVSPGVRLSRCVVWPGAIVRESATDTIFTPLRAVPVPPAQ